MGCQSGNGSRTALALVVDDEPAICSLLKVALAKHGFDVIEAHDGLQALSLMKEKRHCIDLLITDVVMPGINGVTVAETILRECPSTRAVLMSGNIGIVAAHPENDRRWLFVPKPFLPDTLIQVIQKGHPELFPKLKKVDS